MLEVQVEDEIAAAPERVWDLARDFGGIGRWSPGATCELEGSGVGAVRSISTQGINIRERLEALDEGTRTLSYSIVEGPLPLKNYLATMRISPAGTDRSRITWSSRFESVGMTDEQAQQLVEMIYRQGIAGIKKALAA